DGTESFHACRHLLWTGWMGALRDSNSCMILRRGPARRAYRHSRPRATVVGEVIDVDSKDATNQTPQHATALPDALSRYSSPMSPPGPPRRMIRCLWARAAPTM